MRQENLAYRDAVSELEQILESIESEEIDLDQLTDRVQRAAELIRLCRDRIKATELKVIKVVKELEAEETAPATQATGSERRDDHLPF